MSTSLTPLKIAITGFSLNTFIVSHLVWVVALSVALVLGHSWLSEHDARLVAEQQEQTSQVQISSLEQQIKARDAAAAKQVAPIVKIIHEVETAPAAKQPADIAAAIPKVVPGAIQPITVQPSGDLVVPKADALPIFVAASDDAVCRVQLKTSQADLSTETQIVAQKDAQIKTLKKKPSFWHRVGSGAKLVVTGVGIGIGIGLKL